MTAVLTLYWQVRVPSKNQNPREGIETQFPQCGELLELHNFKKPKSPRGD